MKRRTLRTILVFLLVVALLAAGYVFLFRNLWQRWQSSRTEGFPELPADSYFEIHYFDVGEGDAALVTCDGHYLLIDGGDPSCSRFLYAYLEAHGIDRLDGIICSHAHADHVGGLAGALQVATVDVAYAPVTAYDNRSFTSFVKYLAQQGKQITVPAPGDSFSLGSATAIFLGPVDMDLALENENNTSLVVRIDYGNTSFLFTGDAEIAEELSLVESGADLRSTVLKVAHHGSYTSSCRDFLDAVEPEYAVISVGADNAYGHPHEEPLERLEEYCRAVYRTDQMGQILCRSDGKTVTFSCG